MSEQADGTEATAVGRLSVLVQMPAHSAIATPLSYRSERALAPGTLVRVPLGSKERLGIVWSPEPDAADPPDPALRPVAGVLDALPPLSPAWCELVRFAADYYQRALGEVALAALPPQLRELDAVQLARRLKRRAQAAAGQPRRARARPADIRADIPADISAEIPPAPTAEPPAAAPAPTLTPQQLAALQAIETAGQPCLLFGATGSGKTEVYLQAVARLLAREPEAQALVMVPEINLTPQLEERFASRFGAERVVSMHSGMTPAQRLAAWLAAHAGQARIVLGTRMAVFASMPALRLIVVDEEHDPSYKQQEGARYSARDLAVYRGRIEGARVILGSATPSLESWHHSRPAAEGGRYLRLAMPERMGAGALPRVRRVDMNHQPARALFSAPLLDAIAARVARGEQSMLLLNRRGYAPVLHCGACGWKSACPHCSAWRVFHKIDRTLRCHHCGFTQRVPVACPDCGNMDISPIGRGTERLEEQLAESLAAVQRPDGTPVRIARIDADTTRLKGSLQQQLAQVHAGEVDVLVGTQMIAKGHDFRRITLVAAVQPDGALFSSDFRAPERLFSLLMQAGGRAGRDAAVSTASEMWVQTFHPTHPLYEALRQHDYPAFAESQLRERERATLPPFAHQALLRAEARTQDAAQAFLADSRDAALAALQADPALAPLAERVTVYPPVPMSLQRVADVERAQMLLESPSRAALQRFLAAWHPVLHATRQQPAHRALVRWAIDVDPLAI